MVRYDKRTAERGAKYVEDRRDGRRRPGGGAAVGGGGALLIALLAAFCGVPALTDGGTTSTSGGSTATTVIDYDADTVEFMEFLMFDIQVTWAQYFEEAGIVYEPTTLVIFDDSVSTGCGRATSAVGPFYCPAPGDNNVYVDLGFYDQLSSRFGAPGDFAQAYVIAHEVGHHIQSVVGISNNVRQEQALNPAQKNDLSVRLELQADCLAGVWAHSASQRVTEDTGLPIIEPGDFSEGLDAAAAVGDDRIQAQAGMSVDPHTWTHGSSEQRKRWFTIGLETGDHEQCDPFVVANP